MLKTMTKLVILLSVAGVLSMNLASCRTAKGFGEDMQAAGGHLKNSANRHLK